MATKLFAFVLALCALGACRDDVCARKSDCAHGLTCSAEGLCVAAPDGGGSQPVTDAGTDVDGGM
ncbi:MAG TPA: hypothetical protein VIV58_10830 [Kofleriaceae bacterium]